jgi:hypothetical protein
MATTPYFSLIDRISAQIPLLGSIFLISNESRFQYLFWNMSFTRPLHQSKEPAATLSEGTSPTCATTDRSNDSFLIRISA